MTTMFSMELRTAKSKKTGKVQNMILLDAGFVIDYFRGVGSAYS